MSAGPAAPTIGRPADPGPPGSNGPLVVFYVSGHGFGHASRDIEVIDALIDRRPDVRVVVRTAASRWLFDLTLRHAVDVQPYEADTGVVQIDSLTLDEVETIRRAGAFSADLDAKAADEADRLRAWKAALVVADAPPLGVAGAAAARIPSVLLGNFTWDWIYEGYPEQLAAWPDLVPAIRDAYRRADHVLRLPLWGGFEAFDAARITDLPFVARRSRRSRDEVRAALDLPARDRLVLLSFGGFGLETVDWAALARLPAWRAVVTSRLTATAGGGASTPGLIGVDESALYRRGFRYEDLVAACDAVATKPGYGIIAECAANGTAMLYTSRGRFVEYDVLVAGMPHHVRARFIDRDRFHAGDWAPALDALLAEPPRPPQRVDGAETAAERLSAWIDEASAG